MLAHDEAAQTQAHDQQRCHVVQRDVLAVVARDQAAQRGQRAIDTSKAEALPGVKAVATGKDAPTPAAAQRPEGFRSRRAA